MSDQGKADSQPLAQHATSQGGPICRLPSPGDSSNWSLNIGTTLIGSFTGAGLAFISNWWAQRRIEKRDNLAAGRRALFTVRSQLDDFVNYRFGIQGAIAAIAGKLQGAPEWAYAKPIGFNFDESNRFDFGSLVFLLSKETGRAAFERLQLTERTYLDLMARHSDFNNSVIELQKTLAFHRQHGNAGTFEQMESSAGPELVARVRDHQRAIVLRIDRDEQRYSKAYNLLNDAMTDLFGSKACLPQTAIQEKFLQKNLPPLPPALRGYVDEVPKEPD